MIKIIKLICKNNNPVKIVDNFYMPVALTLGKVYKILDERNLEYFILDDLRAEMWIPKEYFKKVGE